MDRRSVVQMLRGALLVAVVLLAQAAVLTHVDVDAADPGAEACVLCVGLSTLGAGNVAPADLQVPVAAGNVPPDRALIFPVAAPARRPVARGPPSLS